MGRPAQSFGYATTCFTSLIGLTLAATDLSAQGPKLESSISNSIHMQFALIPPGQFAMGAANDRDAQSDELPQHHVRLTKPFFLGVHEVTVGQFRLFVRATGYETAAEHAVTSGFDPVSATFQYERAGYSWRNVGWTQSEQHPVLNVNWFDAVAFCEWLSKNETRRYRLPTEAEWEYACRAGTRQRFITGATVEAIRGTANLQDASLRALNPSFSNSESVSYLRQPVPWNDEHPFSARVGSFSPNALGLYDMLGNAAEWTNDWYDTDYYVNSPATDPTGPKTGEGRVVRGGAFLHQPQHCRVSTRVSGSPSYQNYIIGFRVLGELTPAELQSQSVGAGESSDEAKSQKDLPGSS